jgi:ParB family chromosome partitioning protein
MAEPGGRRGLGRGLSALLEEADAPAHAGVAEAPRSGALEVPIELLRRNPDQPRRHFDETELADLAASIREKGVLQPILVRPVASIPGEYQIVAGERRWRAAQLAGLRAIPVLVRELDDLDVLEIGIIENVQRTDLNPLEEALAYKALIDRFGRTQDVVARVVGKSRSHVANALRLLALPEAVREHLAAGRLSAGHARAIATSPDPADLARTVIDRDLSVRQAEALSRQAQAGADTAPKAPRAGGRGKAPRAGGRGKSPDTLALEEDISDALGLAVQVDDQGGRGAVTIRYETLEQLDHLCQRLTAGELFKGG